LELMTSTKRSEPSDEGKGTHCECCEKPFRSEHRWEPGVCCKREFPEGSIAGCYKDGWQLALRRLTEAQAELERVKREREASLAIIAEEYPKLGQEWRSCLAFVLGALGAADLHEQLISASPPSPPAAVEAKPAEPHIQTSPFRQVAEASARPGTTIRHSPGVDVSELQQALQSALGSPVATETFSPAQEQPASPNIVDIVNGYLKRAALEPHAPALAYVIDAVLDLAAAVQRLERGGA
jgi:hypothetical protein